MQMQTKLLLLSCIYININTNGLKINSDVPPQLQLKQSEVSTTETSFQSQQSQPNSQPKKQYNVHKYAAAKHITADYMTVRQSLLEEECFESESSHFVNDKYKTKISLNITRGDSVIRILQYMSIQNDINVIFLPSAKDSISLTYSAKDKTIFQIIEELSKIMGWQISFDGENIMIKKDTPYLYTHQINIINSRGSGICSTSTKTDGGKSDLTAITQTNAWGEIESYLQFITGEDISVNIYSDTVEMQDQDSSSGASSSDNPTSASNNDLINDQDYSSLIPKQDKITSSDKTQEQDSSSRKSYTGRFSVNKEAGLITVYGTQAMHKNVAKFLHQFESKINMQVRFEGKVFAITLNDSSKLGIDLSQVLKIPMSVLHNAGQSANKLLTTITSHEFKDKDGKYQLNIDHIIDALSKHGTVHTLSTPELTIANNQVGIFKYTTNVVFFQSQALISNEERGDKRKNTESFMKTIEKPEVIPTGFTLTLQPSIDRINGNLYVHVKQIIADVDGYQQTNEKDSNKKYPILSYKEFDTKLRMHPRQWVVLGGYITKRKEKDTGYGFPWGSRSTKEDHEEILCILRAFPIRSNILSLSERNMKLYMANRS